MKENEKDAQETSINEQVSAEIGQVPADAADKAKTAQNTVITGQKKTSGKHKDNCSENF